MVSQIGGVRIGWVNATWPFAQLKVTRQSLVLRVFFLKTYVLMPSEVVAVERCRFLPLIGHGVRIVHRRTEYPQRIVFWHLGGSTDALVQSIRALGYAPGTASLTSLASGTT